MTKRHQVFVLVGDDQVPASPRDVLSAVQADGFKHAAMKFGYSESTLRKFLSENHYVAVKQVTFEKVGQFVAIEDVAGADKIVAPAREADPVSGE